MLFVYAIREQKSMKNINPKYRGTGTVKIKAPLESDTTGSNLFNHFRYSASGMSLKSNRVRYLFSGDYNNRAIFFLI